MLTLLGTVDLRDSMRTRPTKKLDAGLNLLTRAISDGGGRKVHEAGDAILAEFSSATAAVNAAIEFQHQMSTQNEGVAEEERLEFRVGVSVERSASKLPQFH